MDVLLFSAGVLMFLIGILHSVLGERLIFRRLRQRGIVPKHGAPVLKERHVRILWASWHLVTIFGFGLAAILLKAGMAEDPSLSSLVSPAIAIAAFLGSLMVLYATNGRHPGWIGLLLVCILVWLA